MQSVSVFGLGRLGFPISVCLASKGVRIVGVDVVPAVLEKIRRGEFPVREPGLSELWPNAKDNLSVTEDGEQAVRRTDITFVLVPTPSGPDGGYRLDHVLDALRVIGRAVRDKPGHIVALNSTVLPGSMDAFVRPALERESGRTVGRDLGLCYNPEFVALGSVVRDFLNPDLILIGESDPETGARLEALYRGVLDREPRVARTNFVNAELAKIALNTFVTMKITFANLVARICERLPGADADVVTAAIGADSRIGPRYLKGGLGYGGPCFPRDNAALACLARSLGVPVPLAEATDRANRATVGWVVDAIRGLTVPGGTVAILGLAYKPDTPIVEESQGLLIAREIAASGLRVRAYDPMASAEARRVLSDGVALPESLEDCLEDADTVVIATPWRQFRSLPLAREGKPLTILDCWRILEPARLPPRVRYLALGRTLP